MIKAISIAPVNSLIFISDPDGGIPPEPIRGRQILATPSCISVGCYPEVDGETNIMLGLSSEVDPGDPPAFDAMLETPHRSVVISTVESEDILKAEVPSTQTRIRIWLSHPRWPERVTIGLE